MKAVILTKISLNAIEINQLPDAQYITQLRRYGQLSHAVVPMGGYYSNIYQV